jgi:hypothetical protein
MKAFGAALIALAILCVVDFEYNDGRFAGVIEQAADQPRFPLKKRGDWYPRIRAEGEEMEPRCTGACPPPSATA